MYGHAWTYIRGCVGALGLSLSLYLFFSLLLLVALRAIGGRTSLSSFPMGTIPHGIYNNNGHERGRRVDLYLPVRFSFSSTFDRRPSSSHYLPLFVLHLFLPLSPPPPPGPSYTPLPLITFLFLSVLHTHNSHSRKIIISDFSLPLFFFFDFLLLREKCPQEYILLTYSISRYLDDVVVTEARGRPETIHPTFACPTSSKGVC